MIQKQDNNSNSEQETVEAERRMSDGFKALEDVFLEVALADQRILRIVCDVLQQENKKFKNVVINSVCKILSKLNQIPSLELLKEAEMMIGGTGSQAQ